MEIKSQSPIFIFGTGTFGVDTARALLSSGYNVTGFVSNQEIRNNINGIHVYEWEHLSIDADAQLLLGILNPTTHCLFTNKRSSLVSKRCSCRGILLGILSKRWVGDSG